MFASRESNMKVVILLYAALPWVLLAAFASDLDDMAWPPCDSSAVDLMPAKKLGGGVIWAPVAPALPDPCSNGPWLRRLCAGLTPNVHSFG